MSYKSILVLAFGRGDGPAIQAGAWLAAEHGAVAHVLPVNPDIASELAASAAAFGGGVPAAAFDAAEQINREAQTRIEKACTAAAKQADLVLAPGLEGPRMVLHEHDRLVWSAIERACVLADLVVMSGDLLKLEHDRAVQLAEEVLMRQRQPLLVVRGSPERIIGRALIAWNGRIEAARAVRAALPLCGGSWDVDISSHGDEETAARPGMEALAAYLKLHDVGAADCSRLEGEDAGQAILDACAARDAGLLVAGAYGHSRLREFVLGGVTRTLLQATDGPSLLLAH